MVVTDARRIESPSEEIISAPDAREFLRETSSAQDETIKGLIAASREWLEAQTARNFGVSKYQFYMSEFIDFTFQRAPLKSDSVTITYNEGSELDQSSWKLIDEEEPARVEFVSPLPSLDDDLTYPVKVVYEVGYSKQEAPTQAVTAMKLIMSHYYTRRDPGTDKVDYQIPIPERIYHFVRPLKLNRFL